MTAKTIIAAGNRHQLTAVALRHPLLNCPAVARPLDYYRVGGRNIGLVLQFADGHTASMTYKEIARLQAADGGADGN